MGSVRPGTGEPFDLGDKEEAAFATPGGAEEAGRDTVGCEKGGLTYEVSREVLVRGISLCYLAAFCSLFVQL